jgi:hypothetical protein
MGKQLAESGTERGRPGEERCVWPEERVWDILARRSMAMAGDKGGGRLNITGGEGMESMRSK